MSDIRKQYKHLFQTEEGKEVFKDILERLGYGETLSRVDQRQEIKAVARYDFAVELIALVYPKGEKDNG